MSQTFSVSGRGNILTSGPIYPPIKLNPNYQHLIGLVALYTCNTVRNIYPGNNKFYYNNNEITIPSGCYEIDEINSYIKTAMAKAKTEKTTDDDVAGSSSNNKENEKEFELIANNNTLKCELESVYTIDFEKPGNIGSMLGFTPQKLLPTTTTTNGRRRRYVSDKDVEIIKTSNIFVDTNITGGAFRNNAPCHTIFEFGLSVAPGYNLEKEPSQIIYFPINVSEIGNITIRLVDDEGVLVNFSEDTKTSVRLHLKTEI